MKRLIPILCVTLSLTACSGPDSSGGVALSKDPYPTNADFPHGQCNNTHAFAQTNTGCGWVSANRSRYYIEPGANLAGANLTYADLTNANLFSANLFNANLKYANLSSANLSYARPNNANLTGANLSGANLYGANLSGASLSRAEGNSSTVCPDGSNWGTAGNDCGF